MPFIISFSSIVFCIRIFFLLYGLQFFFILCCVSYFRLLYLYYITPARVFCEFIRPTNYLAKYDHNISTLFRIYIRNDTIFMYIAVRSLTCICVFVAVHICVLFMYIYVYLSITMCVCMNVLIQFISRFLGKRESTGF